jgi:hypothetical protein
MVIRQADPEQRQTRTVTRPATPVKSSENGGWMHRLFARSEPTTFHKCLAVHMASAAPRSAMH